MTNTPRSSAIQVQAVRLWTTTMSIEGKTLIATICSSGSGLELSLSRWMKKARLKTDRWRETICAGVYVPVDKMILSWTQF